MPIDGAALNAPNPLIPLLRGDLKAGPDTVAMVSADAQMTWRELDGTSTRVAAAYRDLGLHPGDRIASLMPNRIALAVHYLAAFKAGLVVTPLNYRYAAPEIDHALEVSAASALVATPNAPTTSRRVGGSPSFRSV